MNKPNDGSQNEESQDNEENDEDANLIKLSHYRSTFRNLRKSSFYFDITTSISDNEDFDSYLELIGEKVKHVHLSDASGINGEGLQIGDGNIDFKLLHSTLRKINKSHFMVPEIWQGHESNGEGFWKALKALSTMI